MTSKQIPDDQGFFLICPHCGRYEEWIDEGDNRRRCPVCDYVITVKDDNGEYLPDPPDHITLSEE